MSQAFHALRGLIYIPAELEGTSGIVPLRLALDTGATRTLIRTGSLVQGGDEPSQVQTHVRATTANGVILLPQLPVIRLQALVQERTTFPVLVHTLPPSATFDGLLGLDFFRGQMLTIDFRQGQILLS